MADEHDEHDGTALRGLEMLEEALEGEDFPMDKEGAAYSVGDIEVPDRHGRWIPVRRVLDAIRQDQFASADTLVRAIRQAVNRVR
jgi:hypothetical protein